MNPDPASPVFPRLLVFALALAVLFVAIFVIVLPMLLTHGCHNDTYIC